MYRTITIAAAALLGACATAETSAPDADAVLAALGGAQVRACPADRVQEGAFVSGEAETLGVTSSDLGIILLSGEPSHRLRLRRLVLAPGATIQWHVHDSVEGMALLLSGELVERRNSCRDPIVYRAGDISPETHGVAHSWRNESGAEATVLVAHRIPAS
ncbi:MAG: cupin domain-containing protein [Hyphomonadaceae bacterium]